MKDFIPECEISQIVRLQKDAGVQMLNAHFSWPEFTDERRGFHQEFVYDAAVFATAHGLPWPGVARAALTARSIFPQLDGLDSAGLWSLLKEALSECLPNLTPVLQHDFTRFLADTCLTRRRLFQAVVAGASDVSFTQLQLEVQLPPTPPPLSQGTDLREWERQQQLARLTPILLQKEEELRRMRGGPRIRLGEIPEEAQLDTEAVREVVRAAVRASEGQILESLSHEATLLSDILQLKQQLTALAIKILPSRPTTAFISPNPRAATRAKSQAAPRSQAAVKSSATTREK